MNINVSLIIMLVAYVFGSITKIFITKIPNKFIPLQNVVIGLLSALVCFFMKLEPNIGEAIVVCLMSTMGAGGVADLIKNLKNNNSEDVG